MANNNDTSPTTNKILPQIENSEKISPGFQTKKTIQINNFIKKTKIFLLTVAVFLIIALFSELIIDDNLRPTSILSYLLLTTLLAAIADIMIDVSVFI